MMKDIPQDELEVRVEVQRKEMQVQLDIMEFKLANAMVTSGDGVCGPGSTESIAAELEYMEALLGRPTGSNRNVVVRPEQVESQLDSGLEVPEQRAAAKRRPVQRPVGPGVFASRRPIARVSFPRPRSLHSNRQTMSLLLQAALRCACDLSRTILAARQVDSVSTLWAADGRHGYSASIFVDFSSPVLCVLARYSPPSTSRDPSSLVSISVSADHPDDQLFDYGNLSDEDGAGAGEDGGGEKGLQLECSCLRTARIPGRSARRPDRCEHIDVLLGEIQICGGSRGAGVLRDQGVMIRDALIACARSKARAGQTSRPSEGTMAKLALSIPSTKTSAEVIAVAVMGPSGNRAEFSCFPVVLRLSKKMREPKTHLIVTCDSCPNPSSRAACGHELCAVKCAAVKKAVAEQRHRLEVGSEMPDIDLDAPSGNTAGIEDDLAGQDLEGHYRDRDGRIQIRGDRGGHRESRGLDGSDSAPPSQRTTVSLRSPDFGTPNELLPYTSWRRRPILPCLSDEHAIRRRMSALREASERGDGASHILLEDGVARCSRGTCLEEQECGLMREVEIREVNLVQWDGLHKVDVRDWQCAKCGHTVRFEGLSTGTVCSGRSFIYCRAVLDWLNMYTLRYCGTGRSAYALWRAARNSAAEAHGNFPLPGSMREPDRRAFSEVLALFMGIIGEGEGNSGCLKNIFRCQAGSKTCRSVSANGQIREALVIDGTATGILDALPTFSTTVCRIEALASRHAKKQHVLRDLHQREGLRHLLRLAVLKTNRMSVLQKILDSGDPAEMDLSDSDPGSSDDLSSVDLNRLASKACKPKPKTLAKRKEAVRIIVESAENFESESSAPESGIFSASISEEAELDDVELEDEEIELQAMNVVGEALRAAFEFGNFEEEESEPQPQPDAGHVDITDGLLVHDVVHHVHDDHVPCDEVVPQPARISEQALPRRQFELARRKSVEDSLFCCYAEVLTLTLCDPVVSLWLHGGTAAETWVRSVADGLVTVGSSSCFVEARERTTVTSIRASEGEGVCPPVSQFVYMLSESLDKFDRLSSNESLSNLSFLEEWKNHLRLSTSIGRILVLTVRQTRSFERTCVLRASASAAEYKEKYSDWPVDSTPTSDLSSTGQSEFSPWSVDEANRSGHFYPGRPPCRPGVSFAGSHEKPCSKQYVAASGISPGVVLVACVCGKPSVLGFSILSAPESLSIVATILMVYFPDAATVFYDAACNLFASLVLRFPWIFAKQRLFVDKFHKSGHTCGGAFDAEVMRGLEGVPDDCRTSNAESANKLLSLLRKSFLRIRSRNVVSILIIRLFFVNLQARWRCDVGKNETENADLVALANRLMPCQCRRCVDARADSIRSSESDFIAEEATRYARIYTVGRDGPEEFMSSISRH